MVAGICTFHSLFNLVWIAWRKVWRLLSGSVFIWQTSCSQPTSDDTRSTQVAFLVRLEARFSVDEQDQRQGEGLSGRRTWIRAMVLTFSPCGLLAALFHVFELRLCCLTEETENLPQWVAVRSAVPVRSLSNVSSGA